MDKHGKTYAPPRFSPDTDEFLRKSQKRFESELLGESVFPDRLGIVLAAGAATRFRPLTASRYNAEAGELEQPGHFSVVSWNKAALPVAHRPLIGHTVADLASAGFRYIIVNVSRRHSAESIIRALAGSRDVCGDAKVMFLVEEKPSGTFGGVAKMLQTIAGVRPIPDNTDVAIFSGDIFTEQPGAEILRYHREERGVFTLMLNPIPEESKKEFGTVEIDGRHRILRFYEKLPHSPSNLNNSSRYVAKFGFLARWFDRVTEVPPDKGLHRSSRCFFDFGLHLFTRHLAELQAEGFIGFVSDKNWADLGRISDYHAVSLHVLEQQGFRVVEEGTEVAPDSRLFDFYHVQRGARIRSGARIRNSTVGSGWIVDGATLDRTLLMPLPRGVSFTVAPGVSLSRCVVGSGSTGIDLKDKVVVYNGNDLIVEDLFGSSP